MPSVRQSDPFTFVYLRGKFYFLRINATPESGLISSLILEVEVQAGAAWEGGLFSSYLGP